MPNGAGNDNIDNTRKYNSSTYLAHRAALRRGGDRCVHPPTAMTLSFPFPTLPFLPFPVFNASLELSPPENFWN